MTTASARISGKSGRAGDACGRAGLLLVALLSIATIPGAATTQERERRPLQIDEALGTLGFATRMPIDLSPDGEWVAYTLEDARRHESTSDERYATYSRTGAYQEASGCDVWITNVKSGASRNLTKATGTSWGPVWSPDGRRLAFYSDRGGLARLWIWERDTDALREVSTAIVRPYFGFASVRWAPDSRRVLLKVLPEQLTVETAADAFVTSTAQASAREPRVTAKVFEANLDPPRQVVDPTPAHDNTLEPISPSKRYLSDIALIDVTTGTVDRVARDTRAIGYWVSPDGGSVAYTTHVGHYPNTQDQHYDLVVISLADRRARIVAPRVLQQYAVTVSWSPDGRSLAYTTTKSQRGPIGEAYVVSLDGGSPRKISEGTHPDLATPYRAPLWASRGDSIYLPARDAVWQLSPERPGMRMLVQVPGHDVLDLLASGNNVGRVWSPDAGRSLLAVTRDQQTKRMGFFRIDVATGKAAPVLEEDAYYGSTFFFTSDVSDDGRSRRLCLRGRPAPSGHLGHGCDVPRAAAADAYQSAPRPGGPRGEPADLVDDGHGTTLNGALLLPAAPRSRARAIH